MTRLGLLAVLLAACLALAPAAASAAPDVVVLAIGSERYARPVKEGSEAFVDLLGVADGARRVAEVFRARGARRVRLLVSDANAVVGRSDMLSAIDATVHEAGRSAGAVIIVYVAAHGVSEGLGWSHYSVPGTMTHVGDVETLAARDGVHRHAVAAAEIVDRLKRSGRRFLLILDTCREGRERDSAGVRETLGEPGLSLVDTVRQATRLLNEFRGADPVLFSTTPGSSVPTAKDPDDELASVGPLARRILLWSKRKGGPRDVTDLVRFLADVNADRESAPAVTHAERSAWWDTVTLVPRPAVRPLVMVEPTGRVPDPCCSPSAPSPAQAMSGSIRIVSSPPGHWLTEEEPGSLGSPEASIGVDGADPSAVTIEASLGEHRWSLTLAAPSGTTLRPGRYPNAERAGMQDDGKPGLSFSTAGRGCNQTVGEFAVTRFERGPAGVTALEAEADLTCDDVPGRVKLSLRLRASAS